MNSSAKLPFEEKKENEQHLSRRYEKWLSKLPQLPPPSQMHATADTSSRPLQDLSNFLLTAPPPGSFNKKSSNSSAWQCFVKK